MVLNFNNLNIAQIFKIPNQDSPHHEIEVVMSFSYLNLLKAKELTAIYHFRKRNDENLLFEIGDGK